MSNDPPIPPIQDPDRVPGPDGVPDMSDIPGVDPDLLDDDVVRDEHDREVVEAVDPDDPDLHGAAVQFESEADDPEVADSGSEPTMKTVTVIDATPERLGAPVQDGPAPDDR